MQLDKCPLMIAAVLMKSLEVSLHFVCRTGARNVNAAAAFEERMVDRANDGAMTSSIIPNEANLLCYGSRECCHKIAVTKWRIDVLFDSALFR